MTEEWFTLDDITESQDESTLYCISVDSPDKQFLAGTIGVPTHNTDAGKEEDALKGEASMIIGSIARLGRAAGVHLIIATQRPDATIIAGETKANLSIRVNAGRTDSNASQMILGNGEGSRVKAHPRGRLYLNIHGQGDHGQGFFADPDWIDNYLASQGLNPDGSPIGGRRSRLANITDMSEFDEADLDSREGVDNSSVIEKIKAEEATMGEGASDGEIDWGFDEDDDSGAPADSWDAVDDSDSDDDSSEPEEKEDDGWGGLELGQKTDDSDKFHRPEEDWDDELDDLIKKNFDK